MTTTGKAVIALIVVLVIIAGGAYWYMHRSSAVPVSATATTTPDQVNPGGPMQPASTTLPGGSSDSDAALNQDTAAIDSQMNGLNSDNTNMNSSLNDQPVSQ